MQGSAAPHKLAPEAEGPGGSADRAARTEICITIDTEFDIAGAFADPARRRPVGEPNVDCPAEGRNNGLPFLLDTFREFGIAATFFVEALQTCWFGDAPMARVVERILRAGQDVQLHLHPCWLAFRSPNWAREQTGTPPSDRCDGWDADELAEVIRQGCASLQRFGAPRPIALRTGNLFADRATYAAMSAAGLHLASNIGVGLFRPAAAELDLMGGRHWIGDVLEVPTLSYRQPRLGQRGPLRLLTITGSSWRETEALLWQARRRGVATVVILTHPFEFIKGNRMDWVDMRRNRINQARLRRVCRFIAEHPAEFAAVSFGEAGPRWQQSGTVPAASLAVPIWPAIERMVQNKANDLVPFL